MGQKIPCAQPEVDRTEVDSFQLPALRYSLKIYIYVIIFITF